MSREVDYTVIRGGATMVVITEEYFRELQDKIDFLNALEFAGVDKWNGYREAQDILESWVEQDASNL